jgi:hypothetical protein
MVKNRVIIVRVTKSQYERVVANAEAKGHKTISAYVRSSVLGFDLLTEARIQRIFDVVVAQKVEVPRPRLERSLLEYVGT